VRFFASPFHARTARLFWISALVATLGCERRSEPAEGKAVPSAPPVPASNGPAASANAETPADLKKRKADQTHRAARCGECHEKMYDEWQESAHARGLKSEAYAATRRVATATGCARCHSPLSELGVRPQTAEAEAVTCEVCHRMEHVEVSPRASSFTLLKTHEIKFGPRCDLEDPYFHRARCNPVFTRSEMCAACHLLYQETKVGTSLPVHTEYADWKKSSYAAKGKQCQSCHMPGVEASLATGEPEREGVPDHGFLGHARKLEDTALTATARVVWEKDRVTASMSVTNARAGHAIPAGSPGREVVLRATTLDAGGRELGRVERAFGRMLEDANGRAAPFFEAARVRADTRLQAGETRREELSLDASAARELRISIVARALAPELAARVNAKLDERELASATIAAPAGGTARKTLVLLR
jgi:hypothetical protein